MEKTKRKITKKEKKILAIIIAVVVLAVTVISIGRGFKSKKSEPEIITVSTLERIINISELSTFTAVYNGIAEVKNEKNPEDVDYYVSYEARVDAGIDFEKIGITVDDENKVIQVTVPEVYITDINVDIGTMDFIFMNDKSNVSSVTQEAFKACNDDVGNESRNQKAILDLAKQNAINILTALIKPVVEQMDVEYDLAVN